MKGDSRSLGSVFGDTAASPPAAAELQLSLRVSGAQLSPLLTSRWRSRWPNDVCRVSWWRGWRGGGGWCHSVGGVAADKRHQLVTGLCWNGSSSLWVVISGRCHVTSPNFVP